MSSRVTAGWPKRESPRERALVEGVRSLSTAELMSALEAGPPSGLEAIYEVLQNAGGPAGLVRFEPAQLRPALGERGAVAVACAFELARRAARPARPRHVRGIADAVELLAPVFDGLTMELFVALLLDGGHRPLRLARLARGGQTACSIHPREVLGAALREGAVGVICAHNHPSGDPAPSAEDRALTRRLERVSDEIGIHLVDHLVFGEGKHFSFRDARCAAPAATEEEDLQWAGEGET